MEFIDDRLSPLDVLELSTEDRSKLLDSLFWDVKAGELFVSGRFPDIKIAEGFVENVEYDDEIYIQYEGGSKALFDECFPLLSIGQLIDIISYDVNLQVTSSRGGWMIYFDDRDIFSTNDRNSLCNLLWQVLKYKVLQIKQPNQLTKVAK